MNNLLIITIMLLSSLAFGQKKKSNKVPPSIKPPTINIIPEEKVPDYGNSGKNCFNYTVEENRDSMVYVTENLLEYGWTGDNARIIITKYKYDPATKKEGEKEGLVYTKTSQFIDGDYKIEKDNLIFIPEQSDKSEKRIFSLKYKAKTKNIDHLEDEGKHQFKSGDCLMPTISM